MKKTLQVSFALSLLFAGVRCRMVNSASETVKIEVYAFPCNTFTKIPIGTAAILTSYKEKFVHNDRSGIMKNITSVLDVSLSIADSIFMKGQVRVGIVADGYSTIYLDRASHILYNEKVYPCTEYLYSELGKLFPRNKRDKYLRDPSDN